MKRVEMVTAFSIAALLILCLTPSTAVPLVPGWEEEPVKYTLEVFAICDNYCYSNLGGKSKARNFLISAISKASRVMSQLNIELVIVGLEIWSEYGWTNWTTAQQNMAPQYQWLGSQFNYYLKKIYFDELLLFSGICLGYEGLQGHIEGFNSMGCVSNSKCAAIMSVSLRTSVESLASVIAHELGHALGIVHDNAGCGCPNGVTGCIMSTAANRAKITRPHFSDCSKTAIEAFKNSTRSIASRRPLVPADVQVGRPTCGNGIVEDGEQCDCGLPCLPAGCCNCCRDCQLFNGAQCASGKCCDNPTCKFKTSGTLCRKSRDTFCDDDDFCSGDRSQCENSHLADWTDCMDFENMTGYCKEGFCNTINVQCRFVWNKDFKAASDSCFLNKSNDVQNDQEKNYVIDQNTTASDTWKCQTLICGGDGKNDGLPDGRNPQRRNTSSNEECLTGDYLQVESSLLGLSGMMKVEDGTKCGIDRACFAGQCIPRADVIRQIRSTPTFKRKTEFCGNGRVEPGEECDCGPEQCACCDVATCKFKAEKTPCLRSCGLCTGKSSNCPTSEYERGSDITDFKQCGGNWNSMCYNGSCISLDKTCQNHFNFATASDFFYQKNVGRATKFYNSGGFFAADTVNNIVAYEEYRAGEDDGACGIVQCDTIDRKGFYFPPSDRPHPDRRSYPVVNFQAQRDKSVRILYYQLRPVEAVTVPKQGNTRVKVFFPLIAEEGTPCKLQKNADGYCRTTEAQSTGIPSITYYYSKCTEIPSTPSNSRYQFYPYN